jgi:hypothetical protein
LAANDRSVECEMLAHYVSGILIPPFRVLGRAAAPVH